MAGPRGTGRSNRAAEAQGRTRSASKTAQQQLSRQGKVSSRGGSSPIDKKDTQSRSRSQRPSEPQKATDSPTASADTAAAGSGSLGESEGEQQALQAPVAAAAKQRQTAAKQKEEARQAYESIKGLAEAAEEATAMEVEQAVGGKSPAAGSQKSCQSEEEEEEEEEGSGSDDSGHCGLIATAPGFKLARGQKPPCFRIWLSLQRPASAADVSVSCTRRCIAITQRSPVASPASPDGICLPAPPPLRAHHVVVPEPLDLEEPAHCILTPQGQLYIEAAIAEEE